MCCQSLLTIVVVIHFVMYVECDTRECAYVLLTYVRYYSPTTRPQDSRTDWMMKLGNLQHGTLTGLTYNFVVIMVYRVFIIVSEVSAQDYHDADWDWVAFISGPVYPGAI